MFRTTTRILLVVGVTLIAAVGVEYVRWFLAGERGNWVILNDPSSSDVAVAVDAEALRILVESPPTEAWRRGVWPELSTEDRPSARPVYDAALRARRILELPNGTRAKVIDRAEFCDHRLQRPQPGSDLDRRRGGRVLVNEILVRDARNKGATGWVVPELMQYEVAWP